MVLHSLPVIAQSCSVSNLPTFQDFDGSGGRPHIDRDAVQVIVPSYTFNCHGRVVQWGACVQPGGRQFEYELELQVLRPLPVEETDIQCFSLVGVYSQTGFPDSPPDNIDHCIVFNIPPEGQIPVQPGDVVGFYSDYVNGDDNNGVQLDKSRTDVTVFYQERTSITPFGPSSCSLIAGPNNIDITTMAAPIITVVVGKLLLFIPHYIISNTFHCMRAVGTYPTVDRPHPLRGYAILLGYSIIPRHRTASVEDIWPHILLLCRTCIS